MRRGFVALLCALSGCCPSAGGPPPVPPLATTPAAPAPAAVAATPSRRAKLVVLVVIDQLGSATLAKYLPFLPENGAFRRGVARGSYFANVGFDYANTSTAPGHAAIITGAPPWQNGVTSNSIYDAKTGKEVPFISDGEHEVIGHPGRTAAPIVLRVPALGDELERHTGDKSLVVSVSGKDRAAILLGGKQADLAVWYDHAIPGFTTSTFYSQALPSWLGGWMEAHPISSIMVPWTPRDPALLARAAGPDAGEGEGGDYMKLGSTFPYDPNKTPDPHGMLRLFPQLSEYTVELAKLCADQLAMGRDEVVDLLALSVSGTDYTGHSFGPDSWEYLDHLIRVDLALGALFDALEKDRGEIAVLITSDHGVMPLPPQNPHGGGRLYEEEIVETAKRAAKAAAGDDSLVVGYVRPFIVFSGAAGDTRDALVKAVSDALEKHPGIHRVFDARAAGRLRQSADRIERAVGLSIADDTPGDLYVLNADGWVNDEGRPRGAGTTHGTPWKADRFVPVVVWGPGVPQAKHDEELSQLRVAPTVARLLDIPIPAHMGGKPLPGIATDIHAER